MSHKSARLAIELGYKNVSVFSAGYPAWKKAYGAAIKPVAVKAGKEEGTIEITTFEKIIKTNPESINMIDVRDPDEFARGHFKTAVNIPVDELEKKIKTLSSDKPIVFVCSTGARSGESFYMIQDLRPDLKEVYYLEAGINFQKDGSYKIIKTQ